GRDQDETEFQNLGLQKADAAVPHHLDAVIKSAEADGDSTHQAGLDLAPGGVYAVLQRPRLFDVRKPRLEGDALLGRLVERHRADRAAVVVLMQEDQRVFELDAKRLNDVANAI